MKTVYRIYMSIRLVLVAFFFSFFLFFLFSFLLPCHFHLTWPSPWAPLEVVALFVLLEELMAFVVAPDNYWSGLFGVPNETTLPAIVFESDRTFVEILCGVAAAILAIALGEGTPSSRPLAKVCLTLSVLLCITYLNLQGASVKEDMDDDKNCHIVKLTANRSTYLLILRNFIYWSFLYGLTYTVIMPK
ncbi:MAG: hypothetical protein ABSB50_08805 [Terracidiphilus sp.]